MRIEFPSDEENAAALKRFISHQKEMRAAHARAAWAGCLAFDRIVAALKENHDTGQPYKIREIIYSLWNGKPADLSNVLCLDWTLRRDVCAVIAGFGFEDKETKFFYDAIQDRLEKAGLMDWFLEEHKNISSLENHVNAVKGDQP